MSQNDDFFCPRPFMELTFHENGKIHPCCLLDDYSVGDIKQNTILEVWNSEKMKNLREEFISGNISTCKKLIEKKGCHKFYDEFNHYITRDIHQENPPKRIDLRLNGKCNLKCIMCSVWHGENGTYTEENFWIEGRANIFPYLLFLDILGGEPMIQSDTFKLIDEVSKVNPRCKWNITTNANWNFQGKIKKYFDKIRINKIVVSLDGILPNTYNTIRKDGNYKQVMKTINDLIQYQKSLEEPFLFILDFVLQRGNFQELITFYEFCKKKGLRPSLIYLMNPAELSVEKISSSDKIKFVDEVKKYNLSYQHPELKQVIQNLEESLPT